MNKIEDPLLKYCDTPPLFAFSIFVSHRLSLFLNLPLISSSLFKLRCYRPLPNNILSLVDSRVAT